MTYCIVLTLFFPAKSVSLGSHSQFCSSSKGRQGFILFEVVQKKPPTTTKKTSPTTTKKPQQETSEIQQQVIIFANNFLKLLQVNNLHCLITGKFYRTHVK